MTFSSLTHTSESHIYDLPPYTLLVISYFSSYPRSPLHLPVPSSSCTVLLRSCSWFCNWRRWLSSHGVSWHLSVPKGSQRRRKRKRRKLINQPNENIPTDTKTGYCPNKGDGGRGGQVEVTKWEISWNFMVRETLNNWHIEGSYLYIFLFFCSIFSFCVLPTFFSISDAGPGVFVRHLLETPAQWKLPLVGRGRWRLRVFAPQPTNNVAPDAASSRVSVTQRCCCCTLCHLPLQDKLTFAPPPTPVSSEGHFNKGHL